MRVEAMLEVSLFWLARKNGLAAEIQSARAGWLAPVDTKIYF